MAAHYVQQPLVRLVIHVTPEQRAALAAEAADRGVAMAAIVRDCLDRKYFTAPKRKPIAGWRVSAEIKPRTPLADAPPLARARLREWVSRLGRRR